MAKNSYIYLILALFLAPLLGSASETRVDSTGGLSLVIDDESVTPNPFIFGNPAGIALLTPQSRFDEAGQWFGQSVAFANGRSSQYYGTLDQLQNVNGGNTYHGLMFFPSSRWGVQLDGDYFHNEAGAATGVSIQSSDRTREFFKTSYNFGPFVLGGELDPVQTTTVFRTPGSFESNLLTSGDGNTTALNAIAGLLACFPGDATPKQERFEIGGVYANQISPAKEIDNMAVVPGFGTSIVSVTDTFTATTAQSFGPQIYFDSPGSFQLVLIDLFTNSSLSFEQDSSNTGAIVSVPSYQADTTSQAEVIGGFKMSNPLPNGFNFKTGLFFSFQSSNNNSFDSNGTANASDSRQNWQFQAGFGLEKKDNFTLGLQGEMDGVNDNTQGLNGNTNVNGPVTFFSYKISAGGERWLSPHLAFRMGFTLLNEYNQDNPIQLQYYDLGPSQRVITTTITAGLGYKDSGVYSDLMLWYGQPSLYDSPSPDLFVTQTGFQLAMGVFL